MITAARTVADAVLYEGYLLYPYRASSAKNQVRWQFGVLGPTGAADGGVGEQSSMRADVLVRGTGVVTINLRFLQLQARTAEQRSGDTYVGVARFCAGEREYLSWDEAVEREFPFGPFPLIDLASERTLEFGRPPIKEIEPVGSTGRLVRRQRQLQGALTVQTTKVDDFIRLSMTVTNTGPPAIDREEAVQRSLLGAHLLLEIDDGEFVSLLDPPPDAVDAVATCTSARCWPVLVSEPGRPDVVLVSPIILYDYPAVAPESAGDLYDSTEIDEILTLRVMTMTAAEKAEARATDPRAAAIVDRCEAMTEEDLGRLHGVLRSPATDNRPDFPSDQPWWDPQVDATFEPTRDSVRIGSVDVSQGSRVRVHPSRRADAQDIFFADRIARVTGVYFDADGEIHVAVVIEDDPAAEFHDWYGRYLYFAPDELEPLSIGAERQ
jgi:hypothetical protein